jgi:ubiquinone/menaquinone biosynthesis C-methylase UbiE
MLKKQIDIIDKMDLTEDIKNWYKGLAFEFLDKIGLPPKSVVLDWGARVGNYTIPVADRIGPKGKVYALDKNHEALDELLSRAENLSLDNRLAIIKTQGEVTIPLEDGSVDFILFYDVIHAIIDQSLEDFRELLREFNRVLNNKGIFSILIQHVHKLPFSRERAIEIIEKEFYLANTIETKLSHWNHLSSGEIYNFKKK